ncbi:MAG: nucleotidyltransferase domain-containing protein [Candidatus Aminicenantes bacterium]|nr:nucleotidyltransferase domain-containing protein [Candidatus Aminicenantes bacterium]
MDDIQIVTEFKKKAQEAYPGTKVYFYGSRVSRTNRDDSDYDVLVILDEVNPVIRDNVYDIAWEVGFKYDAMISPVLAGKEEFVRLTGSPFFSNVKQNGLIL